jgi:hypothetical protein
MRSRKLRDMCPHWRDGFQYSDDVDAVACYDHRHGDHTQPVGLKAPTQLGVYDVSGNVWEWCQDVFTRSVESIPTTGSALRGRGVQRVLRGGCFHNWAVPCTVGSATRSRATFTTDASASGLSSVHYDRVCQRCADEPASGRVAGKMRPGRTPNRGAIRTARRPSDRR